MPIDRFHDQREQIRQAVDLVELVGSYIPLVHRGPMAVGICPWHDDTRPSLQVNPARQSWKCWVCDVGGDIFSFVMKMEGVDFREALELLAERSGISLQRNHSASGGPDKKSLYGLMAWAEEQYQLCLQRAPEAEPAREYLAERGINPTSCEAFHVGFAPRSWSWLLDRARTTPYSAEQLQAAGLVISNESQRFHDRFRGRVLFPIRDTQHRTIGFGGRILPQWADDRSAKYINSPETRLFSKNQHVYALDRAQDLIRRSRSVLVVEGYTDAIVAHQSGIKNAVAVLGTALGSNHIRLLRRYADTITLVLDGDEAGQRRTNELLRLFIASEVDLRILTLPEGQDPCDFLLQHGADALRGELETAPDAMAHAVNVRTTGLDLVQDTHAANQALESLLQLIAESPRLSVDTSSSRVLRERQVIARLAREFQIDEVTLRQRVGELRSNQRKSSPSPVQRVTASELAPHERELLEILALAPELVARVQACLPELRFSLQPAQEIYQTIQSFAAESVPMEFGSILSALNSEQLQNLWIDLDHRARQKEEHAESDAAGRLEQLLEHLGQISTSLEHKQIISKLERNNLTEEESLQYLEQIVKEKRERQGIPAPTDG